jgi:hypothetical protein
MFDNGVSAAILEYHKGSQFTRKLRSLINEPNNPNLLRKKKKNMKSPTTRIMALVIQPGFVPWLLVSLQRETNFREINIIFYTYLSIIPVVVSYFK